MASTNDIIINLRVAADQAKADLKSTQAQMKEFQAANKKGTDEYSAALENVAREKQKVHKHQEALNQKISKQFPAWALSVMFFGMVVHRTLSRIWRSAMSTFQDVSHSVEGTVTQFDHLNGAMTWLQFVAGQALEPIAAALYPIILAVADWIRDNEELFRGLVVFFGATGTFAALIGGAITAVHGISKAFSEVVASSKNADWAGVRTNIMRGIGVISIAWALKKAMDTADSESFTEGLINAMSAAALAVGGVRAWRKKPGGGYFIALGVALDLVGKNDFFESMYGVIATLGYMITEAIEPLLGMIGHMFEQLISMQLIRLVEWLSGIAAAMGLSGVANALASVASGARDTIVENQATRKMDWSDYWENVGRARGTAQQIGAGIDSRIESGRASIDSRFENFNITVNLNGVMVGYPELVQQIGEESAKQVVREIEARGG